MGATSDSVNELIDALKTLGGEYTHPSYESLGWVFSKERAPELLRIAAVGDVAIEPLVKCIGDTSPTLSMIQGHAVPVGVLCYEVLNRMIYHEEPSVTGDIDPDWAGYITPEARALDLRRAQQAWQRVIRDGTFQRN